MEAEKATTLGRVMVLLACERVDKAQVLQVGRGKENTTTFLCVCGRTHGQAQPAWWCFQDLPCTGQGTPETAVTQHRNGMSLQCSLECSAAQRAGWGEAPHLHV